MLERKKQNCSNSLFQWELSHRFGTGQQPFIKRDRTNVVWVLPRRDAYTTMRDSYKRTVSYVFMHILAHQTKSNFRRVGSIQSETLRIGPRREEQAKEPGA